MRKRERKRRIAPRIYRASVALRRFLWLLSGGRRETVFNTKFNFTPSTHFPAYRGLRLPKKNLLSTIVRFGDYVQLQSAYLHLQQLQRPPVVVDIGAHHGVYAVILGKLAKEKGGTLIAVEPNPEAFAVLRKNVERNGLGGTVLCENVAVAEEIGSVRLAVHGEESMISAAGGAGTTEVQAAPLSAILQRYSAERVDLLIIDVEGAELGVLRSIDWKRTAVDRIYCELHPYNWKHFGYSAEDLLGFLRDRDFRCFDMYFREIDRFPSDAYVGPTLFIPQKGRPA